MEYSSLYKKAEKCRRVVIIDIKSAHLLVNLSLSSLSPQPQEVPKPQQACCIFMYFYVKIMSNLQVQCISDKVQHTSTIILLKKGKK